MESTVYVDWLREGVEFCINGQVVKGTGKNAPPSGTDTGSKTE